MTTVFDGKKMKNEILHSVSQKVATFSHTPLFTDILIGDDPVNAQYVAMKKKMATKLGFGYKDVAFSADTPVEKIVEEIHKLNTTPDMAGIIVQLPLPPQYNKAEILDAVDPRLDVDVLGTIASEQFYNYTGSLISKRTSDMQASLHVRESAGNTRPQPLILPTANAVMKILDAASVDLQTKKILILGQGPLVGKPVAHLLKKQSLLFDIVTRQTPVEEKLQLLAGADVIISAMGVPNDIAGDMIKEGVIIIDAGTSEMEGSIVGDVHFESVAPKASFITPTPGGVGPVTVACLFENVCTTILSR